MGMATCSRFPSPVGHRGASSKAGHQARRPDRRPLAGRRLRVANSPAVLAGPLRRRLCAVHPQSQRRAGIADRLLTIAAAMLHHLVSAAMASLGLCGGSLQGCRAVPARSSAAGFRQPERRGSTAIHDARYLATSTLQPTRIEFTFRFEQAVRACSPTAAHCWHRGATRLVRQPGRALLARVAASRHVAASAWPGSSFDDLARISKACSPSRSGGTNCGSPPRPDGLRTLKGSCGSRAPCRHRLRRLLTSARRVSSLSLGAIAAPGRALSPRRFGQRVLVARPCATIVQLRPQGTSRHPHSTMPGLRLHPPLSSFAKDNALDQAAPLATAMLFAGRSRLEARRDGQSRHANSGPGARHPQTPRMLDHVRAAILGRARALQAARCGKAPGCCAERSTKRDHEEPAGPSLCRAPMVAPRPARTFPEGGSAMSDPPRSCWTIIWKALRWPIVREYAQAANALPRTSRAVTFVRRTEFGVDLISMMVASEQRIEDGQVPPPQKHSSDFKGMPSLNR